MLRAAVWLLFGDGSRGVTGLVRRDLPRGRPRLLRRKLGLAAEHEADAELAQDLLTRMAESQADFTLSFRLLRPASVDTEGDAAMRALLADGCACDA
jgi:uncharacterized protein YdiU (UPF0061 family)